MGRPPGPSKGRTIVWYTHEHFHRWDSMIQRCENPKHHKYELYGARGIAVCNAWYDFEEYLKEVVSLGPKPSPTHSIDRIDNDKGYEPGNIKWSSHSEQMKNRRRYRHRKPQGERKARSNTKTMVLVGGEAVTIKHAAALLGVRHDTLKKRLQGMRARNPGLGTTIDLEKLKT